MLSRRTLLVGGIKGTVLSFFATFSTLVLAATARIWTIKAGQYKANFSNMRKQLIDAAKSGGSVSPSLISTLFPLNPDHPEDLSQIAKRTPIDFKGGQITNSGAARHYDFTDASIGAITVFLPQEIKATFTVSSVDDIVFNLLTPDDKNVPRIVIQQLPKEFGPPAWDAQSLKLSDGEVVIGLTNKNSNKDLQVRLDLTAVPTTMQNKVAVASAEPMTLTDAGFYLMSVSVNGCSTDSAHNDDDEWSVVIVNTPANQGKCSVINKAQITQNNQNNIPMIVLAGGFSTRDKALTYMRDVLKDRCPS